MYTLSHLQIHREAGSPFSMTFEKQIQPVLKNPCSDPWLPRKVDVFCSARRSSVVILFFFSFCFCQSSCQAMGSLSFYLPLPSFHSVTHLFFFLHSFLSNIHSSHFVFHSPALMPLQFAIPVGKWFQVTFPFLS